MSVLEVKNASIRYMTGDFKDIGLKEYVMRRLTHNYSVNEFWADKDISFSLEKGDMLGIIGSNGAGKSTLLKAVAGIMEPTYGSVQREGSIAALLELGSGFDGDLTVRENTYLRGALLGYTRKFMDDTYDSIIEFAELQNFQDRPFKQLSSGMQSRLAFSIASLVRPDILILDEVLSVGDGAFRKKSEEKMKEIIGGGATTILVSHSLDQVREMCNKVLWLDKGEQVAFGDDVQGICDQYEDFLAGRIKRPEHHTEITSQSGEEKIVITGNDAEEEAANDAEIGNDSNRFSESQMSEEVSKVNRTKRKLLFLECVLAVCLLMVVIHTGYLIFAKLNPYGLDSDVVNDISYRQLSWEQKSLFPKDFDHCHESLSTRPVLLYWLFYGITNNFLLAFQLENMCTFILELAAIYYLMKKLLIRKAARFAGLLMFVVFLPGDIRHVNFWSMNYYVMFVIAIMATLAMRISLRKEFEEKAKVISKSTIGFLVTIFIIAIYFGYGSIKMLLFLYFPLMIFDWGEIIINYIKRLPQDTVRIRLGIITLIAIIVNLLSNVIFNHIHPNSIVKPSIWIAGIGRSLSWDILSGHIRAILECFGIMGEGPLSSISGMRFLCSGFVALFGMASVVWLLLKKTEDNKDATMIVYYWLFVTFAVAVYLILIGSPEVSRYYCMTSVMLPVLCSLAINDWMTGEKGKVRLLPCVTFLIGIMCLFGVNVKIYFDAYNATPPVLTQVASFCEDNGYQYVTASFWNAGVIKGYTNGRVDSQHSDAENGIVTLSPHYWLTDKSKYSEEKQGIPNILLLTDAEEAEIYAQNSDALRLIQTHAEKVYEVDQYNLYALTENPYTLIEKMKNEHPGLPRVDQTEKTDTPDMVGFIYANAALSESSELVSDGSAEGFILWGPYSQTVAGKYNITLNFAVESFVNSDEGFFDVALDTEQIAMVPYTADQTSVTLENVIVEEGHQFEARVWVPQGMIVRVQSIKYERVG